MQLRLFVCLLGKTAYPTQRRNDRKICFGFGHHNPVTDIRRSKKGKILFLSTVIKIKKWSLRNGMDCATHEIRRLSFYLNKNMYFKDWATSKIHLILFC